MAQLPIVLENLDMQIPFLFLQLKLVEVDKLTSQNITLSTNKSDDLYPTPVCVIKVKRVNGLKVFINVLEVFCYYKCSFYFKSLLKMPEIHLDSFIYNRIAETNENFPFIIYDVIVSRSKLSAHILYI